MKNAMNFEVEVIYEMLWNVLALHDKTACYYELPYGAENDEIDRLIAGKIRNVRIAINRFYPEMSWTKRRLLRIVNETEAFTLTCEIPGVVSRWKKVNPRILFFEAAFELADECPDLFREMQLGLSEFRLECYPDEDLMQEHKVYFEEAKKRFEARGMEYSEDALFQEELLRTLREVFLADFEVARS